MPSTFSSETSLFGIGISFESNYSEALRRALAAFPQENAAFASDERVVHVVLVADEAHAPSASASHISGSRLEVVDRGITVTADGERGRGDCVFHPAAVDSEPFATAVNTIVLFLVAQAGRIPVHASAVIIHQRALVLAGRSGMGKSALALAADRAGLPVLSEDTVFVQMQPSFGVWGRTEAVHLFEKDAPSGVHCGTRIRSGRVKRAIPIVHQCRKADRAILFLLTKGDSVIFQRLGPEEAVRTLTRNPEPGYDFYGARLEAAIRALAADGCWQLSLSANPDEAIAALVRRFAPASESTAADARGTG